MSADQQNGADEANESFYFGYELEAILSHKRYRPLRDLWHSAEDKIYTDPASSITSAGSLLEQSCRIILEELNVEHRRLRKMPELYAATAKSIGIHASSAEDIDIKSLFGSIQNILQKVAEIRNRFGDAHGRSSELLAANSVHAQLAFNLATSICQFLLQSFECHLAAMKRVDFKGRLILRFDKTGLLRLADHTRNADDHIKWYDEKIGPSLLLVGDSGIYLIGSGLPAMLADGFINRDADGLGKRRLVVYADGCDPSVTPFEAWWAIHGLVDAGSDFSIPLPLSSFEEAINIAEAEVILLLDAEEYFVIPDIEYPIPSAGSS